MNRSVPLVIVVLLAATLAPVALAHEAESPPPPTAGGVLTAPWTDPSVLAGRASLFEAAAGRSTIAVPGGQVAAAHDGRTLVLDVFAAQPGWYLVALDEQDERPTHLMGTSAVVRMHEAAAAATGGVPPGMAARAGALGVFGGAAEGTGHGHGAAPAPGIASAYSGVEKAWVRWDGTPLGREGGVDAGVLSEHGGASVLRFIFPLDTIGSGFVPGELRHLVVYHGKSTAGVPEGPFLAGLAIEAGEFQIYAGREGETLRALRQVAASVDGEPDPWGGILPLAGVAGLTVAALIALYIQGGSAGLRRPRVEVVYTSSVRARGVGRAVLMCVLMLVPALAVGVPPASAAPGLPVGRLLDAAMSVVDVFRGRDPCEDRAWVRTYDVSAIDLDIIYNRWGDHDPEGMMYVLDEDIPAVRAERAALQPVLEGDRSAFPNGTQESLITPLVLRARVGECIEIRLKNRLDAIPPAAPVDPLGGEPPHAPAPHVTGLPAVPLGALPFEGPEPRRVSLHMHGLPIDPKNAGGDALGENPDTSVGPQDTAIYRIRASYEGTFFFHDHADPTSAGVAAFPAIDSAFRGGTVHGLFGALVVEPSFASWTHPTTGAPVRNSWKADIIGPGKASFREFVIFYHDPQIVARDGGTVRQPATDHGLNYRVETLSHRLFDDNERCPPEATALNRGVNPCEDISLVYASNVHGDPGTPIPRAYLGDPTKVRLVHAGMEETHAHHLHGHRWRAIDGDRESTRIDSQTLSPSETFTETLEAGAGGEGIAHAPGDYIYHCHLFPHLYGGMWSFFRVHDRKETDLRALPSNPAIAPPSPTYRGFPHFMQERQEPGFRPLRAPQAVGPDPGTGIDVAAVGAPYADVCPRDAPVRRYRLAAVEVPIRYNQHGDHDPEARIFVLAEDADAVIAGTAPAQPAVLRIRQGECMTITLLNRFPVSDPATVPVKGFGKVSIHTHLLEYDVLGSDGTSTGWIPDQTIWQGEEITNRFYADRDLETIVWHDHAAGLETAFKGIYGATLVEPRDSDWLDPRDGSPIYTMGADGADGVFDSGRDPLRGDYSQLWRADVVGRGFKSFREFFTSVQDFANLRTPAGVPYRDQIDPHDFADFGLMAFNLRSEPLWHRLGNGSVITNSTKDVFSSVQHGDPATDLWEAYVGDRTIVRLHQVAYEEIHSFQLSGHRWNFGYRDSTSPLIGSQTVGISEAFNMYLDCGAGGCARSAGDYLYRGGGIDDVWAGAWGLFRVHASPTSALRPLPDAGPRLAPEPACAPNSPVKAFDVVAIEKELIYNGYGDHDMNGRMYVLAHEEQLVRQGILAPKPLTLRVIEGDCVKITLTNKLPAWSLPHAHADPQPTAGFFASRNGPENTTGNLLKRPVPAPSNAVSLHAHVLTSDVRTSGGGEVGQNPDTTVPPGGTRTYTFRADVPAPAAALLEDLGDIIYNRHHGLFGAIVVMPKGTQAIDSKDGYPVRNSVTADILGRGVSISGWRDIALFYQNGLALTDATGIPLPLPGTHSLDILANDAVVLAQAGLRDFLPGAAGRAVITDVTPAPSGHYVRGALEGVPFRAEVHRRDGVLEEISLSADGFDPSSIVRLTGPTGAPLVGVSIQLGLPNGSVVTKLTNVGGNATFSQELSRGTSTTVRLPAAGGAEFATWTDSERTMRLRVRASVADLPLASIAGRVALDHLRNMTLPAGPVGLAEVDVSRSPWRVLAGDAVRTYDVLVDPTTRRVISLDLDARAVAFGPITIVSGQNATRVAQAFVTQHFGTTDALVHLARSRQGHWQVDLATTSWATRVDVDGVTGRVLGLYRGSAVAAPTPLPADTGVVLEFRKDNGAAMDGTPIEVLVSGAVAHSGVLGHGGRFVVPDTVKMGIRDNARLRVRLPTFGVELPLALAPNGTLLAYFGGIGSPAPVDLQASIVAARGYLAALAPPGGALLNTTFGLAGVEHGPGVWRVRLASSSSLVEVSIDDATGHARGARVTNWRTPVDDCSGEVPEHTGPHRSQTACRWSFSGEDEESQGLHAFNYRAEPLENRLNRVPDPGLVFSSGVHGENGVEVYRAYPGDRLTLHLIGAVDKGRVTAFSLSGHSWPREPQERRTETSQAQGGIAPGRVFLVRPIGGAGAATGFSGDYMIQGAVQRQTAETGEWAILRVLPARDPSLRNLSDIIPLPPGVVLPLPIPPGVPPVPPVGRVKVILGPGPNETVTATPVGRPAVPPGRDVPVLVEIVGDVRLPKRTVDVLPSGFGNVAVTGATGGPADTREGGSIIVWLDVPTRAAGGGSAAFRLDVVSGADGARTRSSAVVDLTLDDGYVEPVDPVIPTLPTTPLPTRGSTPPVPTRPAKNPLPPGSRTSPTMEPSEPSGGPSALTSQPGSSTTQLPTEHTNRPPTLQPDPDGTERGIAWGPDWLVVAIALAVGLAMRRRRRE